MGRLCLVGCPWPLIWLVWSVVPHHAADLIIEPPLGSINDELVVDKGGTFSLTCTGDTPIAWNYSYYEPLEGETRSKIKTEDSEEFERFKSILTIEQAYFLDTGMYSCFPSSDGALSPWTKSIYVYVKDPEHPLAVTDTMQVISAQIGTTVELPCRPTDPSLEVVLKKDNEEVPGTSYYPRKGFTFFANAIAQSGDYFCYINGSDSNERIQLFLSSSSTSLEVPHISVDHYPVVEGMNITFKCSEHYGAGDTVSLRWNTPVHIKEERVKIGITDYDKNGMERIAIVLMNIFDITKKDEGDFSCSAADQSQIKNSTYSLKVLSDSVLNMTVHGKNTIKVHPGQKNVQIIIGVTSHPPVQTTQWFWYSNNKKKPIPEGKSFQYSVTRSSTSYNLTIFNPEVQSSGIYSLFADNGIQNNTTNITVLVEGEPYVQINGGNKEEFYKVGQLHEIECQVYAFPPPNITWHYKSCQQYPNCNPKSRLIPPTQYTEMEVNSLQSLLKSSVNLWINETGEIVCKARNSLGVKEETTTALATDIEDKFMLDAPTSVVKADNITLSCGASKYRYSKDIQWFYTGMDGNTTSHIDMIQWSVETDYSYFTKLNIPTVKKHHEGNYTCVAKLRYTRGEQDVKVYVMRVLDMMPPVINKTVDKHKKIKSGKQVEFICEVNGVPTPNIVWFKDGNPIYNSSKYVFHNKGKKLNVNVGLDEDGIYNCTAYNKGGQDSLLFKIEVTDKTSWWLILVVVIAVMISVLIPLGTVVIWWTKKLKKKIASLKNRGAYKFEEGNIECLNPDLDVGEQADLLPFDSKKWGFPRNKLTLGMQLGAGAFGVVMKAEAYELEEPGVTTTVAVKMIKDKCKPETSKALVSELKIMSHLGKHINVVNLLGACTEHYITKNELLVIVEYCKYGNLHDYLINHRGVFINQVNPETGNFDSTLIQPISPTSPSVRFSDAFSNSNMSRFANGRSSGRDSALLSTTTDTTFLHSDMTMRGQPFSGITPIGEDGYLISRDHEWRNQDRGNHENGLKPLCTQDLICWSFQIARGLEYLASRKILHGDVAARNVLLAEGNIVKICDFGFSKSMYTNYCYKKKGDKPLPVKWLAVECLTDQVFSTQSDIWSYGVTIWELFSLGRSPYPGIQEMQELTRLLQQGYRMEKPKYATTQAYRVMMDCWHINPNTRPSFTELAERFGGMLEDTVRTHYVDLNDPCLRENREFLAQRDYLSMLRSPNYTNLMSPPEGYSMMKPIDDAMELTPMLDAQANRSTQDSPDSSPTISNPLDTPPPIPGGDWR